MKPAKIATDMRTDWTELGLVELKSHHPDIKIVMVDKPLFQYGIHQIEIKTRKFYFPSEMLYMDITAGSTVFILKFETGFERDDQIAGLKRRYYLIRYASILL